MKIFIWIKSILWELGLYQYKTPDVEVELSQFRLENDSKDYISVNPNDTKNLYLYMLRMGLSCMVLKNSVKKVKLNYAKVLDSAIKGNAEDQYMLGMLYSQGVIVKKNSTHAFRWINASAKQEYPKAMNALANFYKEGFGVEKDFKKSFDLWEKAYKAGYKEACGNLIIAYQRGLGVEKNLEKAFSLFKKHNEELPCLIPFVCDFSRHDTEFAKHCINKVYDTAIHSHDANLMSVAAYALAYGSVGFEAWNDGATYLFVKAAAYGNEESVEAVKDMNRDIRGEILYQLGMSSLQEQDYAESLMLLPKSFEYGNSKSCHTIGCLYEGGIGVCKSDEKAVEYFTKAHQMGNIDGTCSLAICYVNGKGGLEKDFKKAFELFSVSAEAGNFLAQYNLGIMYIRGEECPKNKNKAMYWLSKSAEQGYEDAQYRLGLLYLEEDENKEVHTALRLLEQAAEQGHVKANMLVKMIKEKTPFKVVNGDILVL